MICVLRFVVQHPADPIRIQYIRRLPKVRRAARSRQRRVVLREVLVVVGVLDRLARVALREALRRGLAVDVVLRAAVGREVSRLREDGRSGSVSAKREQGEEREAWGSGGRYAPRG